MVGLIGLGGWFVLVPSVEGEQEEGQVKGSIAISKESTSATAESHGDDDAVLFLLLVPFNLYEGEKRWRRNLRGNHDRVRVRIERERERGGNGREEWEGDSRLWWGGTGYF